MKYNNDIDMYKFELDIHNNMIYVRNLKFNDIIIYKQEITNISYKNSDFIFTLQDWAENWLDERELYDVEYQVFIRIH